MSLRLLFLASSLLLPGPAVIAGEEVLVIGHSALPKTDKFTVQRLYTGRAVSIGQQQVLPVNLPAGNSVREDFLLTCMEQSEEQYTTPGTGWFGVMSARVRRPQRWVALMR